VTSGGTGDGAGNRDGLAVGIDVAAIPVEALGAGQYTVELVRALDRRADLALTLVARRDDVSRWREIAPRAFILGAAPSSRVLRLAWEEVGLSATRRRRPERFAVLHGPHYCLPAWAGGPSVVTVHDLTWVDHPEWHERSKVAYFSRALRLAARRAEVIVCVSQATADRYTQLFGTARPVVVVPHGVDHARFSPDEPTVGYDERVLHDLGVRQPYVLHTGTLQPRKDLPTLVTAWDKVAGRRGELSLVLAGGTGWDTEEIDRAIASSAHVERIARLGHVSDEAVAVLVRRAAVVAYPSLEEGFGLPALEAMACGAPLVTTARSVMAEVARDAALLVEPSSPVELAEAIDAVLDGGEEVERRSRSGRTTAATYTWQRCAEGHVEAYCTAARSRTGRSR